MELPIGTERKRLARMLRDLSEGLEDLVNTGLAAASEATVLKVDVAFKEASGRRLLRLGSICRILKEEMKRYLDDDPRFSKRRFGLFANRGWLLARRMAQVVEAGDESGWRELVQGSAPRPLPEIVVLALGVAKNVAEGTFCAFDFRLRVLHVEKTKVEPTKVEPMKIEPVKIEPGDALMWSVVYPLKNQEIAPETFLQLTQPQKFRPSLLLKKPVRITAAAAADGRLFLGPKTTVEESEMSYQLDRFQAWDRDVLRRRWRGAEPGPLDLDIERREEVVLSQWTLGKQTAEPLADRKTFSFRAGGLDMTAVAKSNSEGRELLAAIERLRRLAPEDRPPIFGLLHYELCRLVFQPLSTLGGKYPKHLMIGDTKTGAKELLKSLDLNS